MLDERDLLSEDIASAKKWVRRKYGTHRDYEEFVQEAAIALWRAREKGDSRAYAFQAMKWRIMQLITPEGKAQFLGTPRQDVAHAKHARGEKTREKVRQFVTDYRRVQGVTPTPYCIAQATGIGEGSIRNALKHLWTKSATEVPRTPPTTRWLDESDLAGKEENSSSSKFFKELNKATAIPAQDTEVLDRVLLSCILADTELTDVQATVLKGMYWEDRPQVEIAREIGIPPSTVQKWHNETMGKLKETAERLGVVA